ncbi:MAG TPA: protein phosphatase 2C domain-containing protein [Syntrophales bacterium]|nr:protein phosphatase 2C domain-containing protein [Syntrophales bacterium]
MLIRPGNAQHIGSRNEQQDSFAFSRIEDASLVRRAGVLAVLADGMGGLAMGREASDCTVKTILSSHARSQPETPPTNILQNAVKLANNDVLAMAQNAGVDGEVGSTLVAVIVKDNNLYWTSVGDSRIYLYRSGELVPLTTAQNYDTELLQRVIDGTLSMEEAQSHPDRAALTNFIGNQDIRPADSNLKPFPISDGDWIILCSDGLFGTLTDYEIKEELFGNPHDSCERLIKKVLSRNKPHQDNTTVTILTCGDRNSVTIRTKKKIRQHKIFTPEQKQKKFRWISILVALAFFVALTLAAYIFYKQAQKHLMEKPITIGENIQKSQSGSSEVPISKGKANAENENISD